MSSERLSVFARKEAKEVDVAPTLFINDRQVLVEITDRCLAFCPECYTMGRSNPEGLNVDFDKLVGRLDWISVHTNANELFILGGEPLLHPRFRDFIDAARKRNFKVTVITSAMVNPKGESRANLEYLLQKYEEGDIDIEVSLHPDINEKAFADIYRRILALTPNRRKHLTATKYSLERSLPNTDNETSARFKKEIASIEDRLSSVAFYSTVTLTRKYLDDFEDFKRVFHFLDIELTGFDNFRVTVSDGSVRTFDALVDGQYQNYLKNYLPYASSRKYSYTCTNHVDDENNIITRYRFWCAVEFAKHFVGNQVLTTVYQPLGEAGSPNVCKALQARVAKDTQEVYLDSLLVRTDGEATFSTPACIGAKTGIVNVDRVTDPKQIYRSVADRFERIDRMIHLVDRHKASSRPLPADGENCSGCPLDVACNLCYKL